MASHTHVLLIEPAQPAIGGVQGDDVVYVLPCRNYALCLAVHLTQGTLCEDPAPEGQPSAAVVERNVTLGSPRMA